MKGTSRNTLHRLIMVSLVVILLLSFNGCGIQQSVVRSTMNPILEGGLDAMMAETNLEIAQTALASNLKLIEGMLRSDPHNSTMLLFAAQGYAAYALAFVEDEDPVAARDLYRRARGYANRWLIEEAGVDLIAIPALDDFEAAVLELDDDAQPGIFWLGNAWGSEILNGLNDIVLVAKLPYAEALMRRSLEIDPGYYYGLAHLFFGGYYGARPRMLGGNPDLAVQHINEQIDLTDGNILLGPLFMVKFVYLKQLDEESARTTLQMILDFDVEAAPENTFLLNRVAQAKAEQLLANLEDYL
ncbi:TRAP transporter TatT component family protein [bacterium]|nr:TRAP transporter TatT component family protein [bacterium]